MGKKAKTSRKGKKAWRANIKTDDIDEYFEKTTKDALSGASNLDAIPSDSLFYVDKSTDIPVKRKIEKNRERILHHESLLQKNAFVKPVPSSILKKYKKRKDIPKSINESQITSNDEDIAPAVVDVWNEGGANVKAKKRPISVIPAIEVEPLGCSFNPPFEAHQDSLAQAVADEMQKIYRKELAPQPVPLIVHGKVIDEDDKFFLDADGGDESDQEEDLGNEGDGGGLLAERKIKEKRITRVEQNRRARRKELLKAEAEVKKLESLSKELDSLPDIMKEIAKEDKEKELRKKITVPFPASLSLSHRRPPPQPVTNWNREAMEEVEGKQNQKKEDDEQMKSDSVTEATDSYGYGGDGQRAVLRFDVPPRRDYHFFQQFRDPHKSKLAENPNPNPNLNNNNFLKGVKWSPDGSSFLTSSDDNTLRLFSLPQEAYNKCWDWESDACLGDQDSYGSNLIVNEAETVYDYCWYPYMSSSEPTTCVFASTTRDHPIHLWDAITGQLRCTYRAYDAMDEITAALSVSFNCPGTKIFAGYNKFLRVFDVHRPGRDFEQYPLHKGSDGPSGIVSSIAFSPTHSGMLAIGSYSHTTAVYAEANMELLYVLHGQVGGVTQVLFSKDGNYIYTGGRKDPYILCWDIRNTAGILYKLYRSSEYTNQRISFDIEPCGRHLGTGGQDGLIHIYDLQTGQWTAGFQAASDTVNGFSFHPTLPVAASSSGSRRFSMSDDFEKNISLTGEENCVSVWAFSCSIVEDGNI